jgi:hypothetical protein
MLYNAPILKERVLREQNGHAAASAVWCSSQEKSHNKQQTDGALA